MRQTTRMSTEDGGDNLRQAFLEAMSDTAAADTPAPSLLVCVNRASSACPVILGNGVFCVNVLRDDQSEISDSFAGRIRTADGDKFSCAEWTSQKTGAPRVIDPLVAFDCRLIHSALFGTHYVIFGAVQDVFLAPGGLPLIYARRAYGTPVGLDAVALRTAAAQPERLTA
jgi:flavin reductase